MKVKIHLNKIRRWLDGSSYGWWYILCTIILLIFIALIVLTIAIRFDLPLLAKYARIASFITLGCFMAFSFYTAYAFTDYLGQAQQGMLIGIKQTLHEIKAGRNEEESRKDAGAN